MASVGLPLIAAFHRSLAMQNCTPPLHIIFEPALDLGQSLGGVSGGRQLFLVMYFLVKGGGCIAKSNISTSGGSGGSTVGSFAK
jgi:hypothetical protein